MDRKINVFVLYSRTLDVAAWEEQYRAGLVPDRTPYGYHHAEDQCKILYSRPTRTHGIIAMLDNVMRRLLRFDLIHVWNNRREIFNTNIDVIWTHTEEEYLGIAFLKVVSRKPTAPVIAQSVWIFDRWKSFGAVRRAIFRILISKMDVLTFLSNLNADFAKTEFHNKKVEFVKFGISTNSFPLTRPTKRGNRDGNIRVLSIGHDIHRDWRSLSLALGGRSEFCVRVLSRNFPKEFLRDNMSVENLDQNGIRSAYDWADCVVVPLLRNLHASGITVALESISLGIPLIITKTGGLDSYIDDDAAYFVGVGDVLALRSAVLELPKRDCLRMAGKAQKQFCKSDLTSVGYAKRHVQLSRDLVRKKGGVFGAS